MKLNTETLHGLTITRDLVTETRPYHLVAEASQLGIPPGCAPMHIDTTLGNKQPFHLERADENSFEYRQVCGCLTLSIFND
jgi:hypothetical protein